MLTPRGITVAVAGVAMWVCARFLGSPGLEVVAIGLAALPFVAGLFLRWSHRSITATRHLSEARVNPGTRVTVRLDVSNPSPATTSFLLLEDRLPPALGRPARLVVTGVRRQAARSVCPTRCCRRPAGISRSGRSRSTGPTRSGSRAAACIVEGGTSCSSRPRSRTSEPRPTPRARRASATRGRGSCCVAARSTTRCAATRRATTCAGSIGRRSRGPAS